MATLFKCCLFSSTSSLPPPWHHSLPVAFILSYSLWQPSFVILWHQRPSHDLSLRFLSFILCYHSISLYFLPPLFFFHSSEKLDGLCQFLRALLWLGKTGLCSSRGDSQRALQRMCALYTVGRDQFRNGAVVARNHGNPDSLLPYILALSLDLVGNRQGCCVFVFYFYLHGLTSNTNIACEGIA